MDDKSSSSMFLKPAYRKAAMSFLLFVAVIATAVAQTTDSAAVAMYNRKADTLFRQLRYEEAIGSCDSALALRDNATSRYYLAAIYAIQNKWNDAIRNGEKVLQLNSSITAVYPILAKAYIGAHRWQDAVNIGELARQADKSYATAESLENAQRLLETEKIAKTVLIFLFILFTGLVLIRYLKVPRSKFKYVFTNEGYPHITSIVLAVACVSCLLYFLFFLISKWVWSFNPEISAAAFTPLMRGYIYERDGIEMIVLYFMMFINLWVSFLVCHWILRSTISKIQYFNGAILLLSIAGFYFYYIGFFPPLPQVMTDTNSAVFTALLIGAFSVLLYHLYDKNRMLVRVILFIFIAFAALVVSYPSSYPDLTYILSPALRLINGFNISEIYLQYDLLLTLITAGWLKLNLSLEWFPFLWQFSFFIFFIWIFLFTDKLFKSKGLSILFIIALVLVRYFAVWERGVTIFQVSPLRLDLWFILLVIAYKKGVSHWMFGICIGILVILHRNLGLIYLGAYFAMIAFTFVFEILPGIRETGIRSFFASFFRALRPHKVNAGILILAFFSYYLLAGEFFPSSGLNYRKYNIGMLPIAKDSFYWYVPVVLSALFMLLYTCKEKLGSEYFSAGMFIVLLAISNSMYFFGRSHENNILNISAILVLALFLLFDVLIFTISATSLKSTSKNLKERIGQRYQLKRKLIWILPFLFIILTGFFYSARISDKVARKLENIGETRFTYPILGSPVDTASIKHLAGKNNKVYFLDFFADFYNYYYAGYTPMGRFSPCAAWIFKKDLMIFMQELLDDQFIIIIDKNRLNLYKEYIRELEYNDYEESGTFVALSK